MPKISKDRFDYGDPDDVGKSLRRRGKDYSECDKIENVEELQTVEQLLQLGKSMTLANIETFKDFGFYFGVVDGKHLVFLKDMSWTLIGLSLTHESFSTLEAMKQTWELD